MRYRQIESPVGPLLLAGDARGLRVLSFMRAGPHGSRRRAPRPIPDEWEPDDGGLDEAVRQLDAYFQGTLRTFDLPLAPQGTPFQQTVWEALRRIPYGQTVSYGELARRIGRPAAVRAVGLANGSNPIAIVIPCHRVIGANGTLTGYGGGLPTKQALLALERGQRTLL